jgi:hypothetical protein
MSNRASEIKVITIKVHALTTTQVSYSMNQDKSNTVHRPFVARDPKSKELITNFRVGKRYAIQQRVGTKGTEWVNHHGPVFDAYVKYQIRHKQEYRDARIPLGVKEAPEEDEAFFYLDAGSKNGYGYCPWGGIAWQLLHLERGLVYTDEAIVKEAVAAMGWGTE